MFLGCVDNFRCFYFVCYVTSLYWVAGTRHAGGLGDVCPAITGDVYTFVQTRVDKVVRVWTEVIIMCVQIYEEQIWIMR